jgi:hypothetical protein
MLMILISERYKRSHLKTPVCVCIFFSKKVACVNGQANHMLKGKQTARTLRCLQRNAALEQSVLLFLLLRKYMV